MRWLADKVAKALFNVIDMPCDTKACTLQFWFSGRSVEPGWYFSDRGNPLLRIAADFFCRRPYRRRQENMEYERQVRRNGCRGQLSLV